MSNGDSKLKALEKEVVDLLLPAGPERHKIRINFSEPYARMKVRARISDKSGRFVLPAFVFFHLWGEACTLGEYEIVILSVREPKPKGIAPQMAIEIESDQDNVEITIEAETSQSRWGEVSVDSKEGSVYLKGNNKSVTGRLRLRH